MEKQIINSPHAPEPIGPYSHANQLGNLLFVSGQIPLDAASGTLKMDSVEEETEQCMKNVVHVLTEAGYTLDHVLKATIFITDMSQFSRINTVYGAFFKDNPPARECVQVAALPRGVNVEISVIAGK